MHLFQVESKTIASKTAGNQGPLVSVVIPCYNQARYLDECISSVLEQSFGSFEIIVVDDGSNNPEDISLLDHADYPRTTLLRQANQGPSAARNAGIRKARGKYILPLDADDKIAPRFLELCVGVMERNPEIGIAGGQTDFFGAATGRFKLPPFEFPRMLIENALVCTYLFRRSDWEKVGGYNPNMKFGWEDWDFWLSLIELGCKVYQSDETLLFYRMHHVSRNTSFRGGGAGEFEMRRQIVDNHRELYARYPRHRKFVLTGRRSLTSRMVRILINIFCLFVPSRTSRRKFRAVYRRMP